MKLSTVLAFMASLALTATAASSCSYPFEITTSSPSAFYLRIFSYNNLNGRSLQLRSIPSSSSGPARQIVVIDAQSPVLWTELKNGTFYTQAKTLTNQRYALGPVSYLRTVSSTSTSSLLEFSFKNATKASPPTKGFMLEIPTNDAVYSLYHETPQETTNGWLACDKKDYWQLFYQTYRGDPPTYAGCVGVGVETTLAPYVTN